MDWTCYLVTWIPIDPSETAEKKKRTCTYFGWIGAQKEWCKGDGRQLQFDTHLAQLAKYVLHLFPFYHT